MFLCIILKPSKIHITNLNIHMSQDLDVLIFFRDILLYSAIIQEHLWTKSPVIHSFLSGGLFLPDTCTGTCTVSTLTFYDPSLFPLLSLEWIHCKNNEPALNKKRKLQHTNTNKVSILFTINVHETFQHQALAAATVLQLCCTVYVT